MIEKAVRDEIARLSQPYREKRDTMETEMKRLWEYGERYLDKFDICNNKERMYELIAILPYGRLRNRLIDADYEMLMREKGGRLQQAWEKGGQRKTADNQDSAGYTAFPEIFWKSPQRKRHFKG